MQKTYELMLLVASGDASGVKNVTQTVEASIKENGKILSEKDYGKRKLAYPIKKKDEANYHLLSLSMEPHVAKTINEKLRRESEVLRHLLILTG